MSEMDTSAPTTHQPPSPPATVGIASDRDGRVALLLASSALAVAVFLLVLVAVAASRA